MLKFSKKAEYAILAVQLMASNSEHLFTAKEISDKLNISFDFLSKTLQVLMKNDIITSHQGIKGGYVLAKNPSEISIASIINAIEKNNALVQCMSDDECCDRISNCSIRDPLLRIQNKINLFLNQTSIAEIIIEPVYTNIQLNYNA